MNWNDFLSRFDDVLEGRTTTAPYDNPAYVEYVKLNAARQKRWMKTLSLTDETKEVLRTIEEPQQWILITEDWCGDSAHNSPFIVAMAEENPLIHLDVVLRDTPPFLIDQYLTNGGRSIPKLIVREVNGKDLFSWGPRPAGCQQLMMDMKAQAVPPTDSKIELQKWYNEDKGVSVQQEISLLVQSVQKESAAKV